MATSIQVELVDRLPSPRPSPPGRGGGRRCSLVVHTPPFFSPRSDVFLENTPANLQFPNATETASVSPSPGGEGWGEGERHTIYLAHPTSKTLALCLLLVAVVGCRDANVGLDAGKSGDADGGTNDITIKVSERDRDKDGKPDYRIEQFFRGGQRVMVVLSKLNARGVWAVGSRAYHVAGKTVLIEEDDDGDGLFETLIVYRTDSDDFEVFTREANGSVRPASRRILEAHKKQSATFADFFQEMQASTNQDDGIIEERIRRTQKKIQEAGKEMTDENR